MDNNNFWEEVEGKTFSHFLKERIHKVIFMLQSACRKNVFWTANIWRGIAVDLYETFYQASVRTLIAEIHAYKNAGMLLGKTASEEYESYCDILKDSGYIDSVYQRYPGLLHYLNEIEGMQFLFWRECLERLNNDWEEIVTWFHLHRETQVVSVRKSGSDSHCGGKSVVIIKTDSGKRIFYKPHSLENEIFLQEFTGDIYDKLGVKEFRYSILEKKDYGWVEEVIWQACESESEITGFFRRFGILAAITYTLGVGDLHYENLIAHGEYPVIIDAETLFEHMDPLYEWTEKTTGFYSALSSGLFPGGTADLNTAGISGGTGYTSSKEIPAIMNDKTSEICVGYQKVSMPEGKNHVNYQGVPVKWNNYSREIIDGFQATYHWFLTHKDWVLERVVIKGNKLNSRYVSGNTQFFSLGLYASMHPELMAQKQGRYQYLLKLYQNRTLGNLEMEEILRGDIPWLFRKLDDQNIYCGSGNAWADFFPDTIKEQLTSRMERLSEEDCELQKKVIELSCRIFGDESENKNDNIDTKQERKVKSSFDGIEYAKQIAEYILANAIKQGNIIFWLEIREEAGAAKIRPVDIYFYSGIAGIAVFFRKLYQVSGSYKNICKTLETMLFLYTERIYGGNVAPATKYPGMYSGEGSLVYAYQLLYRITKDKKYREYADMHSSILMQCTSQAMSVS